MPRSGMQHGIQENVPEVFQEEDESWEAYSLSEDASSDYFESSDEEDGDQTCGKRRRSMEFVS